jgi:hypothetical protein
MAVFAFTDAYVLINGVDLSDWVKSVQLEVSVDELETTAMGATTKARIAGLKDWTLSIEFNADYAAGAVDITLWPIFGTVVAIEVRPTSGARSATNPGYNGTVLISKLPPVGGSVGDLAKVSVQWPAASTLFRSIS